MILKELNLTNFRNYSSLRLKLDSKINIICGNNAQGKTNLLESIYFLGLLKSHRSSNEKNLIKNNSTKSKIKGIFEENSLKTSYEIVINEDKNLLLKDNIEIKKGEYIKNNIDIIIFYPQDLEIIQGSPINRRNYLNLELGQISNNYLKILSEYNKLLKIRNDYLKKMSNKMNVDMNYFNIVTEYLIEKGSIICKMRKKFIDEINKSSEKIFFKISKKNNFFLKYNTNYIIDGNNYKETMIEEYKNIFNQEVKLGSTLLGPHRDDFLFYLDDINLKEYGSQGQQRIAVLSMKLSEISIFKKYKNRNPLILLDDVFSELDNTKKKNILKYLSNDIQIIITTTDLKNISKKVYENSKIFKIKDGKIINIEKVSKNGK